MNLEQIHNTVRKALARGNTLDDSIPSMVEQAARWIERNQSYKHMERFRTLKPSKDSGQIRLPSGLIKSIRFVRFVAQGSYIYLDKVDPQSARSPSVSRPSSYFMSGEKYLHLDAFCPEVVFDIAWYEYTPWPTKENETNWLIENASDAIVAQTMVFFAGELLTPQFRQLYQPQRDEALRTLALALGEEEYSDTNFVMRFS